MNLGNTIDGDSLDIVGLEDRRWLTVLLTAIKVHYCTHRESQVGSRKQEQCPSCFCLPAYLQYPIFETAKSTNQGRGLAGICICCHCMVAIKTMKVKGNGREYH